MSPAMAVSADLHQMLCLRAGHGLERNACIDGHETTSVAYRGREQAGVGHLPRPLHAPPVEHLRPEQVEIIDPEGVMRRGRSPGQAGRDLGRGACAGIRRLGHDADAAVPGDRAGRPALSDVATQPVGREPVMHVRGVEQRDQHVDVEQCPPRRTPSVSRSVSTCCPVTTRPRDGKGRNPATPFERPAGAPDPASAWRSRPDTTAPAETPCDRAISYAAASTSSSMSSVVRMRPLMDGLRPHHIVSTS